MDARHGHRARSARAQRRAKSWYFAPIRVGDVITNNVTLIDAFEKEGSMGTMLFLVDESRWTNQRDELVRIGQRTSIYY